MNAIKRWFIQREAKKMFKKLATAEPLKGKRTKLIAFAIVFVLGGLKAAAIIDEQTYALLLNAAIGAGLLAAADHDKKPE